MTAFFDTESERVILGSILTNGPDSLPEGITLNPAHYSPPNGLIVEAALSLYCGGNPCDFLSVAGKLRKDGTLEQAGGPAGFTEILVAYTPAGTLLQTAWANVHACFVRREARNAVSNLTQRLDSGEDARDILDAIASIGDRLALDVRRGDLPRIENALASVQAPPPPPPQIIKGLLHKGAKLVLGGGSKSYKTWCFCDMALSVAAGVPWWGFETVKGRTLYLNFELPAWSFAERLHCIANAKGGRLDIGNLDLWNLRGHSADLSTLAPKIIREAKRSEYALIVLDPIYKCLGRRDENAAGDMGNLLNEIERIATETGAAVVFGAHFSKGNQAGKESIDRISGSGVFARDPDAIVVLTAHEEADAYTVEATLRSLPRVEPFAVRWEFPLMGRDDHLDPTKLKQAPGRKPTHDDAALFPLLNNEDGLTTAEWAAAAESELLISKRTFQRMLKRLEVSGKIFKSKLTNKWAPRGAVVPHAIS